MRQRCEEMEGWQRRTREDREFLSCRFQEARALVERLAEENHSLRGLVNGPISSSSSHTDLQGPPLRKGPADGAQVSHARVSPAEKVSSVSNVSLAPICRPWSRGTGGGWRRRISAHRPRPLAVW